MSLSIIATRGLLMKIPEQMQDPLTDRMSNDGLTDTRNNFYYVYFCYICRYLSTRFHLICTVVLFQVVSIEPTPVAATSSEEPNKSQAPVFLTSSNLTAGVASSGTLLPPTSAFLPKITTPPEGEVFYIELNPIRGSSRSDTRKAPTLENIPISTLITERFLQLRKSPMPGTELSIL